MTDRNDPFPPQEPAGRMVQLLNAPVVAQALYLFAQLGVADHLASGIASIEHLASATQTDGPSLHRLLRLLAGEGLVQEVEDGHFVLTPLGDTLRSDSPGSVRDRALYLGASEVWSAWSEMGHSIATGAAVFPQRYGVPFYQYMTGHPQVGAPFNRWMTRSSELDNAAVVASYDFAPFRLVVDVAGGQGATLAAILRAHPALRGILLDLPAVVAQAAPLRESDLVDRCEIVGGDMLEAVPSGGDAYVIKMIFCGEPDDRAVAVLRTCVRALAAGGRVLVVDIVMPDGDDPHPARAMDLLMLTLFGGRIRTEAEFRVLFAAAGLDLVRVISTGSVSNPMSVLEGVPV